MTTPRGISRRDAFRLLGLLLLASQAEAAPDDTSPDVAVSDTAALLFPEQAPLSPTPGRRDARAVWAGVPTRPDPTALFFLHGFDNYVTVDAAGRSRVPDWVASDAEARAGAAARPAAPLVYGLDRLAARPVGPRPLLFAPEDGALATGAFWSRVPASQYTGPARLGKLASDCLARLAAMRRPDGRPYLDARYVASGLRRVVLCGHSGAGLILQEAADSGLLRPGTGVPADLWLFDCTYWSQIAGFVQFCARWHAAGRLAAGRRQASRFVCVYRPGIQTEPIADALRGEVARVLGVPADSLVHDQAHADNGAALRPLLGRTPVVFVRTPLPHDTIPTIFIPLLLQTAAR